MMNADAGTFPLMMMAGDPAPKPSRCLSGLGALVAKTREKLVFQDCEKPMPASTSAARRLLTRVVAFVAGALLAGAAVAQANYPDKPVRWIVPYSAGGGADTVARMVAIRLEKELGQPVVVENLPGGNTLIGASALLRARPDGYTFMAIAPDTLTIIPHIQKVPFDIRKDFSYVGLLVSYPVVLVARNDLAANTPQEAIELIRKQGAKLNYATYGYGSVSHVAMELLLQQLGATMTPVPYKGGAPAALDLIGGNVDMIMGELSTFGPYIQKKSLKAIALAGKAGHPAVPGVPTLGESAVPGFDWTTWIGVVMRSDVPPHAAEKLSKAFQAVMSDPAIKEQLEGRSIHPTYLSPDAFRKMVMASDARTENLIKDGIIKPIDR